MSAQVLRLDSVRIAVRGGPLLIEALSLTVAPGEIVTVMGPSGSGKSTLIAFVGGFLDRASFEATGTVAVGEELLSDQPAERRHLGVLFQDPILFPHLSVGGNLLFGLPARPGHKRHARREAVEQALASAGLEGFADRDPATLSGGQRARVALLRTLLAGPRALLLDEPFSKLDPALRAEFRHLVFELARARGLPILLVTHDPSDARAAGGRLLELASPKTVDNASRT
jgi:putative thiamine transport system ATP-binding protein